MDHCKNKQFIAFIHKSARDKFWCNGYFAWDEYAPSIHPYDTREQKKTAIEIGEAICGWHETGEIDAVILTVSAETFSIVNKENKSEALARFEKRSQDGIKKQEELKKKLLEEKKNKKLDADSEQTDEQIVNGKSTNENKDEVGQNNNDISAIPPIPSSDKKNREKLGNAPTQKIEVLKEEKKRSPLEKRIPKQKEMDKKEQVTPSEPKKKSGLSKIIKDKK